MNLIPPESASRSEAALLHWLLTKEHRPNVLVESQDADARTVVCGLAQTGARPVHHCALPGALVLPHVRQGTLLLENVTALTAAQQQELNAWLTDAPMAGAAEVQVVSVATEPMLPAVREGRFLESLYYRLNIVRMDTPGTAAQPGPTTH
jgi:hypothetical protein